MAIREGLDVSALDDLKKSMAKTAQKLYPKEAKAFLQKQGRKSRKAVLKQTKASTKKRTGNLIKGIKAGKVEPYNDALQVRTSSKGHHAHLIEYGHELYVNGTKTGKFVPGRAPVGKAATSISRTYAKDVEDFVDSLLKEGFEL